MLPNDGHWNGEPMLPQVAGKSLRTAVKGIDSSILNRGNRNDKEAFDVAARNLVKMFQDNFGKFESVVQADVIAVAMSA